MKQLYENTWVIEDQGVRIFLLTGTQKALLIDTGMTGIDLKEQIAQHTSLPCSLLNTHADRDHIAGNDQFAQFYMHPAEAAIYHSAHSGQILPVFDKDLLELGDRTLEIVYLPGHTPGSITVLDRKARALIGGDPIQEDGNIFMFGVNRDFEAYIAGLERLMKRDDFDYIYPSHAKEKVSKDVIPLLIQGAKKILAGQLQGIETQMFDKTIMVYDIGITKFLGEVPSAKQ